MDSYLAELKAILEALRMAVPPLTIYTDNAQALNDRGKGKEHCVSARTRGAAMWRDVWFYIEQIGDGLKLEKGKAHTTWHEVLSGKTLHVHHVGNGRADEGAKAAAQAAEREAPTRSFNEQLKKALAWYRWILDYASAWEDDVDPDVQGSAGDSEAAQLEGGAPCADQGMPHELWKIRREVLCRRCGARAGIEEAKAGFLRRACAGCAAGRAAAEVTGNKNYLWAKYATSWKEVQAKGAMLVAVVAIPRSLVDYSGLDEVAQVQTDGYGSRVLPPANGDQSEEDAVLQRAGAASEEEEEGGEGEGEEEDEERLLRRANTYGREQRRRREAAGAEERWRMPWQQIPDWMPRTLEQPHEQQPQEREPCVGEEGGEKQEERGSQPGRATTSATTKGAHTLAFVGPLVYCVKCANFAHQRVGKGIKGRCSEPTYKRANAVSARLQRLRAGAHPITGRPLV